MKQLEFNLQKRLLIVEVPKYDDYSIESKRGDVYLNVGKESVKLNCKDADFDLICKGSELTEEIAKELVETKRIKNVWDDFMSQVFINYKYLSGYIDQFTTSALESFISAIEANGYYWGENPIKIDNYPKYGYAMEMSTLINTWQKAESRTFNPEKTIIFEIL